MRPLFNKTKIKSWIKKAHKSSLFAYGHGYITDGYAMLVDEPHMHPTILEVFGTLTPECRYSAEQFQKMATLPNKPVAVVDSTLEYAPDAKRRLRIFYDPTTGKKLAIKSIYFDLFDDPRFLRFFTNRDASVLWIICDNDNVAGAIAPFRLQDQLSHMSFRVEEEREQD